MRDDISVWVALLRDVSFPIVLIAYLLLRFEKKIDKLAGAIADLKKAFQKNRD
jgi:hypothetical protein